MAFIKSRLVCDYYIKSCLKKMPYNKATKLPALNMHICCKILYSFSTPIARYFNGKFYFTKYWFSITTKKHQTYALEAFKANRIGKRRLVIVEERLTQLSFNREKRTVKRPNGSII